MHCLLCCIALFWFTHCVYKRTILYRDVIVDLHLWDWTGSYLQPKYIWGIHKDNGALKEQFVTFRSLCCNDVTSFTNAESWEIQFMVMDKSHCNKVSFSNHDYYSFWRHYEMLQTAPLRAITFSTTHIVLTITLYRALNKVLKNVTLTYFFFFFMWQILVNRVTIYGQ